MGSGTIPGHILFQIYKNREGVCPPYFVTVILQAGNVFILPLYPPKIPKARVCCSSSGRSASPTSQA